MGRMRIRHFRRFRQNGPFLAGDKNTVDQKHGLCHPEPRQPIPVRRFTFPESSKTRNVRYRVGPAKTCLSFGPFLEDPRKGRDVPRFGSGRPRDRRLLAWPPLQSLAVKKNFFLCKFWAVKNFLNLVKNGR